MTATVIPKDIVAQPPLQHWRAEKLLCETQRNWDTRKSSKGAWGGATIIYVLLRRASSWPQMMPFSQRTSLELHLCKCQGSGNFTGYQNYHGEWTTGVSFQEVDNLSLFLKQPYFSFCVSQREALDKVSEPRWVWTDTHVSKNRATIAKEEQPHPGLLDGRLNIGLQVISCPLCFSHRHMHCSTPAGINTLPVTTQWCFLPYNHPSAPPLLAASAPNPLMSTFWWPTWIFRCPAYTTFISVAV